MSDVTDVARSVGALGLLLGLLVAALWTVKRFNLRLPGALSGGSGRRIEVIERMALDQKRSILLIRHDAQEHLLLLWQDGGMVIDGGELRVTRGGPVSTTAHPFAAQAQSALQAAGSPTAKAPDVASDHPAASPVDRILELFVGAKLVKRLDDEPSAAALGLLHAA